MTFNRDRHTAINGDLIQYGLELVTRHTIDDGPAKMKFPLVHPVKRRKHHHVKHAARLSIKRFIAPYGTPAVFREKFLKLLGKFTGIRQCIVNVFFAENVPTCGQPFVK